MINLQNLRGGFLIEDALLFGANEIDQEYLNLGSTIGEDMRYQKMTHVLIDYPGEYDIKGIGVKVLLGSDDKLNYIISINGKKIGLIQSKDVMEKDDVTVITNWLYLDDRILAKIEQMELEGEKTKLVFPEVVA